MENIKEQLEEVIKKNLPEKRELKECGKCNACEMMMACEVLYADRQFNQAISQINTTLIADEVLKVVVEKIESYKKIELLKLRSCENDKINWNYHQGKVHQLEDLLSNLSPNKENK
jgi:hypothetical protein